MRIVALDVLRGLAITGMVLVTGVGSWSYMVKPLRHADWHGWTLGDLVFPTFLLSVGFAVGLGLPRRADAPQLWPRVARRVAALIALGLVLNALPFFDLAHLRVPGILQRIALCYLLAVLVVFTTAQRGDGMVRVNPEPIAGAIVAALLLHWAALMLIPVPGHGAGQLDPAGNLSGFLDRLVFTPAHLWPLGTDAAGRVVYDPEGLLSTVPATVNVLFGVLAAWWWKRSPDRAPPGIAMVGAALVVAGLLLDPVFPINKRIWTGSFALLSSGLSLLALSALALLLRSALIERAVWPLRVIGGNAILAFVLSQLLGHLSWNATIGGETLQAWGFEHARALVGDPFVASYLCALAVVALIVGLLAPLHGRAIHFRL